MKHVEITVEPVQLYKILKFEGMADSGGEAKAMIGEGKVQVNGEVETRKRRQILEGDVITFDGKTIKTVLKRSEQPAS